MEEDIKIYKPTLQEQKFLDIPPEESGKLEAFDDVRDKDGLIRTQVESDIMISRSAKELYKSWYAGFRELINNEVRACQETKERFPETNPCIEITIDPEKRFCSIHGIDSQGISSKRFKEVVRWLGRSDNFDRKKSAQMGMGIVAYYACSTTMKLETWARSTDEKYVFLSDRALTWQESGKCDLKSYGTKCSFVWYDSISVEDVVDQIRYFARFRSVPIYLIIEKNIQRPSYYRETHNPDENDLIRDAGKCLISQYTYEHHLQEELKQSKMKYDRILPIVIDNEDYHFEGLLVESKGLRHQINLHPLRNIFLVDVPINGELHVPNFSIWCLNVKDEGKFVPHPSRDYFDDKILKVLQEKLDKDFEEYFSSIKVRTWEDYINTDKKLICIFADQLEVKSYLKAPKLLGFLGRSFLNYYQREHARDEEEFEEDMQDEDERTQYKLNRNTERFTGAYLLDNYERSFLMKGTNHNQVKALRKLIKNPILVTVRRLKGEDWGGQLEDLEGNGIKTVTQFLKEQKIRAKRGKARLTDVVAHYHDGKHETTKLTLGEIDENVVRVKDRSLKDIISMLAQWNTSYYFIKDDERIQENNGIMFDQYLEICNKMKLLTSDGWLPIKDIVDSSKKIMICRNNKTDSVETALVIQNKETLYVFENKSKEFELVLMFDESEREDYTFDNGYEALHIFCKKVLPDIDIGSHAIQLDQISYASKKLQTIKSKVIQDIYCEIVKERAENEFSVFEKILFKIGSDRNNVLEKTVEDELETCLSMKCVLDEVIKGVTEKHKDYDYYDNIKYRLRNHYSKRFSKLTQLEQVNIVTTKLFGREPKITKFIKDNDVRIKTHVYAKEGRWNSEKFTKMLLICKAVNGLEVNSISNMVSIMSQELSQRMCGIRTKLVGGKIITEIKFGTDGGWSGSETNDDEDKEGLYDADYEDE